MGEPRTRGLLIVFAAILALGPVPGHAEENPDHRTYALLINGGQKPSDNALSHLHHLEDMLATLQRRGIPDDRIFVFSADGERPDPDLVVRGSVDPRLWLVQGTTVGGPLSRPDLTNTEWADVELRSATLGRLRKWFERMSRKLQPGDTLLVFVTDHGNRNRDDPGNGTISLWKEKMSVLEFRALLGYLQPGVRVVNVMSQCFSGAFADAMSPFHDPTPTGNVCGFYSSTADRPAYGCYPEGRDRDRIGHAFNFIDAMSRNDAMADAHHDVLVTDSTPDVPIRTSDVYLERRLQEEADRRDVKLDELVDEYLGEAFADRGRWEPEIRLLDRIGSAYGVFSPRSLAEFRTHIDNLQALSKELSTYRDRWLLTLNDLRLENMTRFVEDDEIDWTERLERGRLAELSDKARKKLADELLPALEAYSVENEQVWERLVRLRDIHGDAESAEYRIEIRLAALLRMRTILVRVAAKQWLGDEGDTALAALHDCETTAIGNLPPEDTAGELVVESLPPYEEDLAVVERVLPSWFGIQFGNLSKDKREELELERGVVVVQHVYEDSAAAKAGMQIGDLVLGPPGQAFDEPRRIREWIMSSPQHTPLPLAVLREGQPIEVSVSLDPYPSELPRLPAPPNEGDDAPDLPKLSLVSTPNDESPALEDKAHALFFWATWCGPCKAAVPELLAWSEAEGVPVIAVSDENPETVREFLDGWTEEFPEWVLADELRLSYVSYGVSGTPTFVVVDEEGRVSWRQTGYSKRRGLKMDDWDWERD